MKHLHEYCPGPGAATSDSVVGKRTLVQSLRRLALPTLLFCLSLVTSIERGGVQEARSQVCPAACDTVVTHSTNATTNCYKFKIVNRRAASSKLNKFKIFTKDSTKSLQWICNVKVDPAGVPSYTGPMDYGTFDETTQGNGVWERTFEDPSLGDTASLLQCDSGYVEICLCCPEYGSYNIPIYFETYDDNGNRCEVGPYTLTWQGPACPEVGYDCIEDCDEITSSTSYNANTGVSEVCFTITRKSPGNLYNFDLNIACDAADPNQGANKWRFVSMPANWVASNITSNGASFTSVRYGLENCESLTFCIATDNCVGLYCDEIDFTFTTESDSGICIQTERVDLNRPDPGKDTGCCVTPVPEVKDYPPVQDPVTGMWTYCVEVHRSDTQPMNTITISHTGRKLCLTDVPYGWELTSTGTGTSTFTNTSGDSSDCRTVMFCFETCDCSQEPVPTTITITGENVPTTVFSHPIGPDGGNCCDNVRYVDDHATVEYDPLYPNCLTYKLFNTKFPCSPRNDFHFTFFPGCQISSVTVPTDYDWSYDPMTGVISVYPEPEKRVEFLCCDSLVVKVCFNNCIGPFPPFTWSWSSTYNGVIIDQGSEVFGGGSSPIPAGVDVPGSGESMNSEPNFPNPFGSANMFKTTIPFIADGLGIAQLTITDPTGNVILTEEREVTNTGKHFFFFSGERLPSGTYYYQIEFPKGQRVVAKRTMILVK